MEYVVLRFLWWFLLNVLFVGIAVMEGYDMGTAGLLRFLGKRDSERRVIINSIGPYWEGNQVWIILGLGAIFAAFPLLYGAIASGLYLAFILLLWSLIVRPVSFKFRKKVDSSRWRLLWDVLLSLSGFIPPFVFGALMGTLFWGSPFRINSDMEVFYSGSGLLHALNPMGILVGVMAYFLFMVQGATYLHVKVAGYVRERSKKVLSWSPWVSVVLFVASLVFLCFVPGLRYTSTPILDGPSSPFLKKAAFFKGAWMDNFFSHPILWILPVLVVATLLLAFFLTRGHYRASRAKWAMVCSSGGLAMVVFTYATALFPFLYPSTLQPSASLTVWDSSSSQMTLLIMLISAIIFVPIILLYTFWLIRKLRGPLYPTQISEDSRVEY